MSDSDLKSVLLLDQSRLLSLLGEIQKSLESNKERINSLETRYETETKAKKEAKHTSSQQLD
jgi:hypothetical protein